MFSRGQERGYRVHLHDPVKKRLRALFVVILLAAAGWGLYRLGFVMSGFEHETAAIEHDRLLDRIDFLESENARLARELAGYERGQAMENQAVGTITDDLNSMEAKMLELQEELSFYRSIVSPSSMESGLHVQSFEVERGDGAREYLYKLVLTLVRGNNRIARGEVDMVVEGLMKGLPETLTLKQLSPQGGDELKFSFKYFQSMEGAMVMPKDFEPQRVLIRVKPSSGRLDPVEAGFDWSRAAVGDNA